MKLCRVPAVIITVAIAGAGLAACGGSSSSPSAAASAVAAPTGSSAALADPPEDSPTSALTSAPASSPTPSASPTIAHSAAVKPSVTATAHATTSAHATSSSSSGTHDFTVPSISGDNVVSAYGSYEKIGTARVKVTMCAKQTGKAFSVGAIALVYSASGSSQNIGATILTGPGNSSCVSNTFILYTAHLKVHAFIGGSSGTIIKTGPVLTIY
jgi:hypothetical protein